MLTGKLPVGVELLDVIVIVDDPDAVMDGGLKLAVAPDGSPLAPRVTVPATAPDGVTVTL
jgi:hypothetical protein